MKKRFALVVVLLFSISFLTSAAGFWRRLPAAPVSGAAGQAIVGVGDFSYLIWNDSLENAPQFWVYAAETRSWTPGETRGLPPGAFRPGTALVWNEANRLYALGGGNSDDEDRRAFYGYGLSISRRNQWVRLADTPHPQGAGNALVWDAFTGKSYAFLGSEQLESAFVRYDPAVDRWETLPFPEGWICSGPGAALASLGRFGLYAFQGDCTDNRENGNFAVYDPFRSEWRSLPPLPTAGGAGGSLLWVGNFDASQNLFIYALSGGAKNAPGFGVYRFYLDNNRWEQLVDHVCPTGVFTGNRLAYVDGAIHYWQGSPDSQDFGFDCGGNAFLQLLGL